MLLGAKVFTGAPKSHALELRLDDPGSVKDVELEWVPVGAEQDPASAGGTAWHFALGKAPGSLTTTVRGPEGRYTVDVMVKRRDAASSLHRVVTLDEAAPTTVTVR